MRKLNMWFPDNSVLWLPWLRKSVVWLAQPCRRLSENRTMRFPAMTISTLVEVKYIGSTMLTCDKDQYKNKFGDESECITSILSIYDTRFFIIPWHKMHPTTFLLSSGKSQESLTLLCALRADAEKKLSQPKPEAPGHGTPQWSLCNLCGIAILSYNWYLLIYIIHTDSYDSYMIFEYVFVAVQDSAVQVLDPKIPFLFHVLVFSHPWRTRWWILGCQAPKEGEELPTPKSDVEALDILRRKFRWPGC